MNPKQWLWGVVLLASGCSGAAPIVPVSGRVTLDGRPLRKALIQFMPVARPNSIEAPGPGSTGVTDDDGRYTLTTIGSSAKGAVVGDHIVAIYTVFGPVQRSDAGGGREILPARYHAATELKFTVKPGAANEANWELTSQ
jgi:hypothetical protein